MLGNEFQWEDLFKPEDEASVKTKKAEAKKKITEAVEAGKRALNTPEFEIYRQKYEKAQASIVNSMILYTSEFFRANNGDMAVYGANMARFISKISTLRALLVQVESDCRKEEYANE